MSTKEEKPRSSEWHRYWDSRPKEKRMDDAWHHWARSISRLESHWQDKARPILQKKMREAKRRKDITAYEVTSLSITEKENTLLERRHFLGMIGELVDLVRDVENAGMQIQNLRDALQEVSGLKERLKATEKVVEDRERLYKSILAYDEEVKKRDRNIPTRPSDDYIIYRMR